MKKNIGTIDKVVRIILALIVVILFATKVITGITGIMLLILAGVMLITSMLSFCPAYYPFRISTRK